MAKCGFCCRLFHSEQGVKSHLKRCDRYHTQKNKKDAPLGSVPKGAAASPPAQPSAPVAAPDLKTPLLDFIKSLRQLSTKPDAPPTPQQQRRQILQAVKAHVIDHYRTPLGLVTASMRGAAKLAIERELASLPLEELPFEEVCELAATICDRCYEPVFARQARVTERQRVEREKRHKDEVEALGALLRANRRKKILIQQASQQAHAYCQDKGITGWAHLSVLADIESQLEAFLTEDELIMEAQAIVRSVLDNRFAEAEATLAAARAKADVKWREEVTAGLVLGALVGLVVLSLKYPAQALTIITWIERTFGLTPGAEADTSNSQASETPPAAESPEARPRRTRRRKAPDAPSRHESPWGNSVGGEPAHA